MSWYIFVLYVKKSQIIKRLSLFTGELHSEFVQMCLFTSIIILLNHSILEFN